MKKFQQFAKQPLTVAEADQIIYGPINAPDSGRQVARPIDIFEISPDPAQPRRAIPSAARASWDGRPETVADLLGRWVALVQDERPTFAIQAYMEETDFERPSSMGPLEPGLVELIDLALSIRRDGLTDPITVIRQANGYRLENGERRWLSFHLLYAYTNDEKWRKIPARIEERLNVWRQAASNGARTSLNAISRARQLALLLMDIYEQQGKRFRTFDELVQPGACDRAYYAQVADGEEYRIPRGQSEALCGAIGLKDAGQLRQYRMLLDLPDALWQKADDQNLTEGEIRKLLKERKTTVTPVTVSKPITLRIPTSLAPKWVQVREHFPEASEEDVISTLIDFYLIAHE